jgi:hypothetical protein
MNRALQASDDKTRSEVANPAARRQRLRCLRFSLRFAIVLVLFAGSWLGSLARSARIQGEAVAAIKSSGGSAFYDWQWRFGQGITKSKPWATSWLVDRIGVDHFGHVTDVWLCSPVPNRDRSLPSVATFQRLERLTVFAPSFGNVEMAQLEGLANLQVLDLSRTSVSDDGLATLRSLRRLVCLQLGQTQISDAGVVHIQNLTKLEFLNLQGTKVTDAGLAQLARLPKLEVLAINGAPVSSAGIVRLNHARPRLRIYHHLNPQPPGKTPLG